MSLIWLPSLLVASLLSAIFVSYSISVSLGHIPPLLPYISDAGVLAPERSFFGFTISLSSVLMLAFQVVRFEQVRADKNYKYDGLLSNLNRFSAVLGLLAAFGLSLIAHFQLELKPLGSPSVVVATDNKSEGVTTPAVGDASYYTNLIQRFHWSGAFFTFVGGNVWMYLQATTTLRMASNAQSPAACCPATLLKRLAAARFAIAIADTVFLLSGIVMAVTAASHSDANSTGVTWNDSSHDASTWRGILSLSAAACEWMVTALTVAFVATFAADFRYIRLKRLIMLAHVDNGSAAVPCPEGGGRDDDQDGSENNAQRMRLTAAEQGQGEGGVQGEEEAGCS